LQSSVSCARTLQLAGRKTVVELNRYAVIL
jgi:hypothetical protein